MTKVLICGSRDFKVTTEKMYKDMLETLDFLSAISNEKLIADEIISGGADGPDKVAIEMAKEHNIKCSIFLPDWTSWGRAAGPIRNKEMVDKAEIVIAYWDGESAGTRSTIQITDKQDKLGMVFFPEGHKHAGIN